MARPEKLILEDGEEPTKQAQMSEQEVSELMGAEPDTPKVPQIPTSYVAEPD